MKRRINSLLHLRVESKFPYKANLLGNFLINSQPITAGKIEKIKGRGGNNWKEFEKVVKPEFMKKLNLYRQNKIKNINQRELENSFRKPLMEIQNKISQATTNGDISIKSSNILSKKIGALTVKLNRHYLGYISVEKANTQTKKKIEKMKQESRRHNRKQFRRHLFNFPIYFLQAAPWLLLISFVIHIVVFGYWIWFEKQFYIWWYLGIFATINLIGWIHFYYLKYVALFY